MIKWNVLNIPFFIFILNCLKICGFSYLKNIQTIPKIQKCQIIQKIKTIPKIQNVLKIQNIQTDTEKYIGVLAGAPPRDLKRRVFRIFAQFRIF